MRQEYLNKNHSHQITSPIASLLFLSLTSLSHPLLCLSLLLLLLLLSLSPTVSLLFCHPAPPTLSLLVTPAAVSLRRPADLSCCQRGGTIKRALRMQVEINDGTVGF